VQLSYEAAQALFYLAIMAVLWTPALNAGQTGRLGYVLRRLLDVVWMGLAAYWAAKVFLNVVLIVQLVHIAIQGVTNAQPTRWAGKPLAPANFKMPPVEPLWESLLGAFAVLAVATAAGAMLVQQWQRGWRIRALWFGLFALAAGATASFLWPAWQEEIPKVSPNFAKALAMIAGQIWPAAALLIATLAAAAALNHCVSATAPRETAVCQDPYFALRFPALLVLIVAIGGDFAVEVATFIANYSISLAPQNALVSPWMACWYVGHVASEFISNWPTKLIALAALLVAGRSMCRRWRGDAVHCDAWLVRPGELLATWLVAAVVLSLLVPLAGAWMLAMAVGNIPRF
jgi:hypothetical protein